MRSSAGIRSNQGVGPRAALRSATTSTGLPDPRHLLGRLRKRTVVAAVAGFGAFFGLATLNVVGVTAHPTAAGGGGAGANAQAPAALPPGDFFGTPGAAVHGSAGGQAVQPVQPVTPLLGNGGGAAMLSSGGS